MGLKWVVDCMYDKISSLALFVSCCSDDEYNTVQRRTVRRVWVHHPAQAHSYRARMLNNEDRVSSILIMATSSKKHKYNASDITKSARCRVLNIMHVEKQCRPTHSYWKWPVTPQIDVMRYLSIEQALLTDRLICAKSRSLNVIGNQVIDIRLPSDILA